VGNRWKELFVSFSVFNPAARGWEADVGEEGSVSRNPPSNHRCGARGYL